MPDTGVGEERKVVTILFADVIGSTALGEQLDPERALAADAGEDRAAGCARSGTTACR